MRPPAAAVEQSIHERDVVLGWKVLEDRSQTGELCPLVEARHSRLREGHDVTLRRCIGTIERDPPGRVAAGYPELHAWQLVRGHRLRVNAIIGSNTCTERIRKLSAPC